MAGEVADLLRKHQNELHEYLQQWSQQQEFLITSVLSNIEQTYAEEHQLHLPADQPEALAKNSTSSEEPCTAGSGGPVHEPTSPLPCESVQHSNTAPKTIVDDYDEHAKMFSHNRIQELWIKAHLKQAARWENRKHGFLPRFIHSLVFEGISMSAVAASAALMAYSIDYTMSHRREPDNKAVEIIEWLLLIYYLIEVIIRLLAEHGYFFCAPHAKWNMLDLFLVCYSTQEIVQSIFADQDSAANLSFLRIFRLTKMLKMLRILRIGRTFRELRMIMASMLGSMRTMFWSVIMIVLICFMFAMFMMLSVADYVAHNALNPEMELSLDKYWGSILTAMTSLYMASTGGESWSYVAEPLKTIGEPYFLAFMLYIAFFMFVIVNTLTSIFLEAAMVNADKDEKEIIKEEMKKKHEYIELIKTLFSRMDKDGSGQITKDGFIKILEDSQMLAFLSRLGIDALDAEGFFDILASESATGGIDVQDFVLGCMKIRGFARSLDLLGLIHNHSHDASRLSKAASDCQSTLSSMQAQLSYLRHNSSMAQPRTNERCAHLEHEIGQRCSGPTTLLADVKHCL